VPGETSIGALNAGTEDSTHIKQIKVEESPEFHNIELELDPNVTKRLALD